MIISVGMLLTAAAERVQQTQLHPRKRRDAFEGTPNHPLGLTRTGPRDAPDTRMPVPQEAARRAGRTPCGRRVQWRRGDGVTIVGMLAKCEGAVLL